MMNHDRNHQLYLAERSAWLDRHVTKTSQRALLKVVAMKQTIDSFPEDTREIELVKKLVFDSLLSSIPSKTVLSKEGFFLQNLLN
jgi:peptidyl-tRNA hydrolase